MTMGLHDIIYDNYIMILSSCLSSCNEILDMIQFIYPAVMKLMNDSDNYHPQNPPNSKNYIYHPIILRITLW